MKTFEVCLLLAGAFFLYIDATAREFTSTDGKKIEAEVVTVTDDSAVIAMGTRQFTVPLANFSKPDREFFKKWRATELKNRIPKLDVQVNTGKSNRSDRNDSFDNRIGSFEFTVKVELDERNYELKGATATLAVLGEDCDSDDRYSVMQKSTYKIDLAEGKTHEWKGEELRYEFDDRPPSYWGNQYYGYVYQIKNSSGKVIFEKVIPTKFESGVKEILSMSPGTAFDDKFRNKGAARIYKR